MCCGRPRLGVRLGELITAAVFEYVGRTALTVTGPATGMTYRFAVPGARLKIDPRDRLALAKVAVLRRVG